MALKDLVVSREVVKLPGDQSFEVRGICLHDLAALLEHDYETVAAIFTGETDLDKAFKETPRLIHLMIAHCADEPGEVDKVATLPLGVQVEALCKLWELSTLDPDDLGNVMRGLIEGVQRFGDSLGSDVALIGSGNGPTPSKPQPKNSSAKATKRQKSSPTPSPSS